MVPFRFHLCSASATPALAIMATFVLSAGASQALAQAAPVWETKVALSEDGSYDSNPLMRGQDREGLYGSQTAVRLSHRTVSERSALQFEGEAGQGLYDDSSFNETDLHGKVDIKRKTQRTSVALTASGDEDTTRTGELIDLGLATTNVRRRSFSVSPEAGYALSPLDKVGLEAAYANTTYDNDIYTDYHLFSLLPSYTRALSLQDDGVLSCGFRRYQSDEGTDKTNDSITPMTGFRHRFSEKWSLQAGVGFQFSREETNGIETQAWTDQAVYLMKAFYTGEQDTFALEAQRKQQSFANSDDELVSVLALSGSLAVDNALSFKASTSYQFLDSVNGTSSSSFKNMIGGTVGMAYGLSPHAALSASYGYKREEKRDEPKAIKQNIARIGFTYQYDWANAQ